jgi:hypothetical protein
VVGTATPSRFTNNRIPFSWTDGTPDSVATNTTTGVFIGGRGEGLTITAPADTTSRTLTVYVGIWQTQAKMVAHLSDGSAPDYVDSSLNNSSSGSVGVYTFTYRAASSGQNLSVTFTQNIQGNNGNVTLQSATLR